MKNNERVLEEKTQTILKYLKSPQRYDTSFIPRPFFIEFTGSPSAGKSTTITELDKSLRKQGFRVLRPQEGAEVIRHIERDTPLYNIRTALYALQMLIDQSHGHLYDIIIFDRCVFDAYCWMMYWHEKKQLDEEEKSLIQSFFLSRFWMDKIDAAYFMVCNPEIAMQREQRIAESKKEGKTTNPKTIHSLIGWWRTAHIELSPKFKQLHLIDTTQMGEKEMVQMIEKKTLDILEQKAKAAH